MTTPPSLLAHLTGLAAPLLPPAPENIMAAVASLPEPAQDEVLKGMGFSRPVAPKPAPAPEPVQTVDTPAEVPTVPPTREEKIAQPTRKKAGPDAEAKAPGRPPEPFVSKLLIACASGGLGTDDYDAYCTRAKEAGLL